MKLHLSDSDLVILFQIIFFYASSFLLILRSLYFLSFLIFLFTQYLKYLISTICFRFDKFQIIDILVIRAIRHWSSTARDSTSHQTGSSSNSQWGSYKGSPVVISRRCSSPGCRRWIQASLEAIVKRILEKLKVDKREVRCWGCGEKGHLRNKYQNKPGRHCSAKNWVPVSNVRMQNQVLHYERWWRKHPLSPPSEIPSLLSEEQTTPPLVSE